jgi:poly-gamma-glutamate capsule biosynthesis protein CapA/YwtB (metallophosphatase superfamily)
LEVIMRPREPETPADRSVLLFLCGDVMLGRGIDQILPYPGGPWLHEAYMRSALEYVRLAEAANGVVPRTVPFDYVWGDALPELARAQPQARIVNLETSVTKSGAHLPKGINYKMSPENIGVLTAAAIDCCVLANNHVLDFGRNGLIETLDTLHRAGIKTAGAGCDLVEAQTPAVIGLEGGARVLVFALGHRSSGIPRDWAAGADIPGVDLITDFSDRTLAGLAERARSARRARDLLIASIHSGGNWGYGIGDAERDFARGLVDIGFNIVHGHSSHHPKAIEVYRDQLILYGCGDFLNDYEGISGHEEYRGDLSLMYLPRLCAATGRLIDLHLVPFKIARFQLHCASAADAAWLQRRLSLESQTFGVAIALDSDGVLSAQWG